MARWDGFAQVNPAAVNIFTTARNLSPTADGNPMVDRYGNEVRWWDGGIDIQPDCTPAHLLDWCPEHPEADACGCLVDPICADTLPAHIHFDPFWVYVRRGKPGCIDDQEPGRVRRVLEARIPTQVAKALSTGHAGPSFEDTTNLSTGGPTCAAEGMGAAMRAMGTIGIEGGAWLVSPYAIPTLLKEGLIAPVGSGYVGPMGIPVVTDFGLANLGPGPNVPGTSWLHLTVTRPVVAVHPTTKPVLTPANETGEIPRMFWDEEKGCFLPMAKRPAIAVWSNKCTFSVQVVHTCDGCLPGAPEDEEEGGEG